MKDEQFYELVFDQYKGELAAADTQFQRAIATIAGQIVLAGSVGFLGTLRWLHRVDQSTFAAAYYVLISVSVLCMGIGFVYTALSLKHRQYDRLTDLKKWAKWRNDKPEDFRKDIVEKLLDAQAVAVRHNKERGEQARDGVQWTCWGMVFVGATSLMYLVLRIQEL